jgi:hypothetical protein
MSDWTYEPVGDWFDAKLIARDVCRELTGKIFRVRRIKGTHPWTPNPIQALEVEFPQWDEGAGRHDWGNTRVVSGMSPDWFKAVPAASAGEAA